MFFGTWGVLCKSTKQKPKYKKLDQGRSIWSKQLSGQQYGQKYSPVRKG
jgi:hypothetical protein